MFRSLCLEILKKGDPQVPKLPKLYRIIGLVFLGCVVAAAGLGVGLSAIINASLNQSGSQLDVLFQGSEPGAGPNVRP
jgi:hypothetical protein